MLSAVKNTIRTFSAGLFAATGLTRLYRRRVSTFAPLLRVLLFHDLQRGEHFADVLAFVGRRYRVITPDECFDRQLAPDTINVLITFDDGYASWVTVALPVLASLDIRALFFVSSGLLDAHDDKRAQRRYVEQKLRVSPRETLSWSGLRTLSSAGHTIGGHTKGHSRLSDLDLHHLSSEIHDDKIRIETMLAAQIRAFAYPFGEYPAHAKVTLTDAGYTHAFSVESNFARLDVPLRIPRIPVDDSTSMAKLRWDIEGSTDLYEHMKNTLLGQRNNAMHALR